MCGRADFWNFYEEFTDYQWAVLEAAEMVDPTGDNRADRRAAHNNANLMAVQIPGFTDEDFRGARKALAEYLPTREAYDEADEMRAARLLLQKQEGA